MGGWGLRAVHFFALFLGSNTLKLVGRLPHRQAHSQRRRKGRQGTLKLGDANKNVPMNTPTGGWVGVQSSVCQRSTRVRVGGSFVVDPPLDRAGYP